MTRIEMIEMKRDIKSKVLHKAHIHSGIKEACRGNVILTGDIIYVKFYINRFEDEEGIKQIYMSANIEVDGEFVGECAITENYIPYQKGMISICKEVLKDLKKDMKKHRECKDYSISINVLQDA